MIRIPPLISVSEPVSTRGRLRSAAPFFWGGYATLLKPNSSNAQIIKFRAY